MAKNLIDLIRCVTGVGGSSGQSFRNDVTGAADTVKVTDYLASAFAFNAALTTYIANAVTTAPGTAVAAGSNYNVTFVYTGGSKMSQLFAVGGGELTRLNVDMITHAGRITVTYVSRSGNTVTYNVLFRGPQGTLNSVSGATSSVPTTLTESDELYKARWTMTPNVTTGATANLGFGFRGKPDSGSGSGFNDEYFEGTQWYLTVNGGAVVDADLEFAWTSDNLSPLAGGTVVSTAKVFTTANGVYVPTAVSSEFHNVTRYGWCRLIDPVGTWLATGAKTFVDPRM